MPIKLFEDGTIIDYAPSPGARKPPGGRVNGSKRKTFELNGKHKRFIRSSAIRQALTSKYAILFATLTFPKPINQRDANRCFSNFIDNLSTNFKLQSYVAVKENTKQGRPHFHILMDIPFTDFQVLNKAWCSSFRSYMPFSRNAFTTGRDPIIRSVKAIAGYITKYITKVERSQAEVKPQTRQYFVSMNVHSNPQEIPCWMKDYLLSKQGYEHYEGDFFTWYRLWDFSNLPEHLKAALELLAGPTKRRKQSNSRKKPVKSDAEQLKIQTNFGLTVDFCYNS